MHIFSDKPLAAKQRKQFFAHWSLKETAPPPVGWFNSMFRSPHLLVNSVKSHRQIVCEVWPISCWWKKSTSIGDISDIYGFHYFSTSHTFDSPCFCGSSHAAIPQFLRVLGAIPTKTLAASVAFFRRRSWISSEISWTRSTMVYPYHIRLGLL